MLRKNIITIQNMYRSFVRCDDPNGVVECGTIRKCKNSLQKMEHKIESLRAQKNSNKPLVHRTEKEKVGSKGIVEEYPSPSLLQLLGVSREAQKINHMIDSSSKGKNHEEQSKDVAKDFLKGALHLQEPFSMPGKLQEASHFMAQLKKKKKERSERTDSGRVFQSRSCRFGDQSYEVVFQKPRLSADRHSRDCIEELREAIRDGLAKQNLISNRTIQEKAYFDWQKLDSSSDMPSTNSSKSSMFRSDSSHSTDSFVSQIVPKKKWKGPNLIARLMGLEDIPSKACQQIQQKQMDTDKNVSPRRSFDIEVMPKIRKPEPISEKVDSEQRALKEIMETMHFKGLLKSNSIKARCHELSNSHSRLRSMEDIPAIVLIKPMRVPHLESEEALAPRAWEEGGFNEKMLPAKKKVQEWLTPRLMAQKDRTLTSSKIHFKAEEEFPIKMHSHEEGYMDHAEVVDEHKEKEVKIVDKQEGSLNENQRNRKLAVEKAPSEQPVRVQPTKDQKVVVKEEKAVITRSKGLSKLKASTNVTQKQQKKETSDKKSDKNQKAVASVGKIIEREIVKPKSVSRSQDQAKVTSTKLTNSENGLTVKKNQIRRQCSPTPKTISRHRTGTAIGNSKDQKKKEKIVCEPKVAKLTTKNVKCKEDNKKTDLACNSDSVPKETITTLAVELSTDKDANASELQVEEDCSAVIHYDTLLTSENDKDAKSSKAADDPTDHVEHIEMNDTSIKTGTSLKVLLLNCSSFVNHAKELFYISTSFPKKRPTSGIYDFGITDTKLILDYANEFIVRRSLLDSETRHPLSPTCAGNSQVCLSLDQLLDEVCTGVETIRNYGKFASDNLHMDSLYAILERDIKHNGVVSSIWDLGWRNGFSADEVEQIVHHIEKLLVSDLIDEVFT